MKIEESLYNLGYPAYGARFIRDDVLLVAGGGGEGNNGIPNKLTALQVNFKKRKVIKRFRELTLDPNDDSPTTLDAANDIILMGCNESTAKIKSSGENHHLRKYVFENDHLKFVASVDFDRSKSVEDYTKLTYMSQDGSVAAVASSKVPTIIRILNPVALTETYEIETGNDVKDLHFSPDGKVLSYITVSTLEVISIVTGRFIIRKTDFDKNWALSKIRFIGEDTVLIAAALKKGSGIVLVKISLKSGTTSVLKTKLVTTKFKGVTSMDVDSKGQLAALAGNDNSIAIVRLKNFTVAKLFKQVHTFAVTRIVFSPDSKVLASVSAANTLHVILIPDNLALSTSFYEKVVSFFINVILIVIVASVAQVSYKYDLHSKFYGYIHSRFLVKNDTSSYFKINEIFRQTTLVGDVISVSTFTRPIDTELSSVATNYAQTASTESGLDDRDLISDTTVISSSTSFASPTSSFSSISEISSSYKAYDNSVENNYAKSISDKLDITSDTFSSLTASSVTSLASSSITPETLSSSESSITTFDSSLEPSSSFSTRSELTTRVVHDVEQKESRSFDSTSTGKQGLSLSKIPKVTESVLSTTQTKATSLFVSEESTVPTVNTITEEITDPQSTSSTSNAENTSEFSQNPTKDEPTSSSASQDHTILGSSADFSSSSTTTNEVAADSYLSEVFDKDQLTTDQPLTLQTTVEISSSEDISTELTSDDGNYFTSEPPSSVTDVKLNDLKTVVTSTPHHDLSEKSEKSVGSAFSAPDKSLETSYQDISGFEKSVTAELTSSDEKSATTYTSSIDLSFTTEATVLEVGSGQVESAEEELDIYVDARTDVASSQLDDDISRYSSNYGHSTESETTTGTFVDAKETPADIFDEDKEVHAPPTTEWETQKIHASEESHKAAAIPEDFDDQFTPDLTSVNSVARDGALGSLLTTETKPSSYGSSVTVGPSDPSSVSVSSNEHNSHTNSYSQSELDNDSMDESAFDRSAPFTKNDIEHDEL